jgi:SPOR domain
MTDSRAALGSDRLPWLADEPAPSATRQRRELWALGGAALLLVGGGAYWVGTHLQERPQPVQHERTGQTAETVKLPPIPEALPAPSANEVQLPAQPEVESAPVPVVPIARPKAERHIVRRAVPVRHARAAHRPKEAVAEKEAPAKPQEAAPESAPAQPLTLWPAWQSQGASGRIVRIGAFGSRQQAKLGWRYMVRAYPAVAHLPATVVEVRNSRGRPFYRFQIGTTSQAHSEVLCQRMQKIRFSCAVVGLPWRPQGVER